MAQAVTHDPGTAGGLGGGAGGVGGGKGVNWYALSTKLLLRERYVKIVSHADQLDRSRLASIYKAYTTQTGKEGYGH